MANMKVREADGQLVISVPWYSPTPIRGLLVVIGTVGIVVLLSMAVGSAGLFEPATESRSVAASLFSVAAAVLIAYCIAAYSLNQSSIRVANGKMSSRTWPFPLPWTPSNSFEVGEIRQVYLQVTEHQGAAEGKSYQVCALLTNDDRIVLLDLSHMSDGRIDDAGLASRIEQHVESFLGIEDQEVGDRHFMKHYPPS